MRRLAHAAAAAALAFAQLTAAPAGAAPLLDLHAGAPTRVDAFAGARLRIAFGGREAGKARLSLAAAPALRSADPSARLRIGDGVELGLAGRARPELSLAGYRLREGAAVDRGGRRLGVSTIGVAAIVGGVIVAGLVVTALAARADDN
ncbi:MAG: hypothetical protein ACJ8EB_02100 [Allosphingosinicella sp.]